MKNKSIISIDSSLKDIIEFCEPIDIGNIIKKLTKEEEFTAEELKKFDKFSIYIYNRLIRDKEIREKISITARNRWNKIKSNGKTNLKNENKVEKIEKIEKDIPYVKDPRLDFHRKVEYTTPEGVKCTLYNINMELFNSHIKDNKEINDFFYDALGQYIFDEKLVPTILINGDFFTSDKDNMSRLQGAVKYYLKYVAHIPAIKREDLEYFANKSFGSAENYVNANNDPVMMINPL